MIKGVKNSKPIIVYQIQRPSKGIMSLIKHDLVCEICKGISTNVADANSIIKNGYCHTCDRLFMSEEVLVDLRGGFHAIEIK